MRLQWAANAGGFNQPELVFEPRRPGAADLERGVGSFGAHLAADIAQVHGPELGRRLNVTLHSIDFRRAVLVAGQDGDGLGHGDFQIGAKAVVLRAIGHGDGQLEVVAGQLGLAEELTGDLLHDRIGAGADGQMLRPAGGAGVRAGDMDGAKGVDHLQGFEAGGDGGTLHDVGGGLQIGDRPAGGFGIVVVAAAHGHPKGSRHEDGKKFLHKGMVFSHGQQVLRAARAAASEIL